MLTKQVIFTVFCPKYDFLLIALKDEIKSGKIQIIGSGGDVANTAQ